MKNLIKLLFIVFLIFFLSLYFSNYNNSYYENKKILTDEAIERFEKDLKEGKEINAKDYLPKEKDYNNKASKLGIEISNVIEKTFKKSLKIFMKYLEKVSNS